MLIGLTAWMKGKTRVGCHPVSHIRESILLGGVLYWFHIWYLLKLMQQLRGSVFSLTLMSKGEKRTSLCAFVAINAKGGDCWHVLQAAYACHWRQVQQRWWLEYRYNVSGRHQKYFGKMQQSKLMKTRRDGAEVHAECRVCMFVIDGKYHDQ